MTPLKVKTVTELQKDVSGIVAGVEKTGKQVIITRNGHPVAVLQRITEDDLSVDRPKKKK